MTMYMYVYIVYEYNTFALIMLTNTFLSITFKVAILYFIRSIGNKTIRQYYLFQIKLLSISVLY